MDIVLSNNRYDEELNVMTLKSDGSVSTAAALTTGSNLTVNGYITYGNNVWNRSADGIYRTYYATNEISYYCCGGNSAIGHVFYNNGYSNVFQIKIMVMLQHPVI
jgi:hypothetical protein